MVLRLVILVVALIAASPALAERVLVAGTGNEGATIQTHLEGLGHTVTRSNSDTLPVSIASFDSLWVHTLADLSSGDILKLQAFVEAGKGVYLNSSCCPGNANGEALVNGTVTGAGSITIGGGSCTFSGNGSPNPSAANGITTRPYSPVHMAFSAAGCITGAAAVNRVVTGSGNTLVGAWRDADMVGRRGRLVVVMDSSWAGMGDPWIDDWVANVQRFLQGVIFADGFESRASITATALPPPNAAGWNAGDVTVTFACLGIAACPAPVIVTAEGAGQVVTRTAVDQAGNTVSASVTVNLDRTPPTATATLLPAPNAAGWNNTNVAVTFVCSDTLSGVETCPTSTVTTEGAGQTVSGIAIDRAGNNGPVTTIVSVDRTPPTGTTTLLPGPNAAGWNNTDVAVSFLCSDTLSGVETCPPSSTVSTEGASQTVSASAIDRAGNNGPITTIVNVDKAPPAVSVSSPADGAQVGSSPAAISGSASDSVSGATGVTCNGADGSLSGGSFLCMQPLALGPNAIAIAARDVAGNTSAPLTHTLNLDILGVTITSPANLSVVAAGPITVTGTTDRPVTSVIINGIAADLAGQAFTANAVPLLHEGPNIITATAAEADGAVGTGSITVNLDSTPPRVSIDTPTDEAILASSQVTVTGMVNDTVSGTVNAEQATVTVNGVAATISNRSFTVSDLLLVRGLNTLTAVARDPAGNEGRTEIKVTYQDQAGRQRVLLRGGNNQTALIGATLQDPLIVALVDANGRAIREQPVTFRVAANDGLLRAAPQEGQSVTVLTNDQGEASVFFQVGTRTGVGNNQVAVSATGVTGELMFGATATVGPPVKVLVDDVMTDHHRGVAGAPLPGSLRAMVFDAGGNPVAGVPVVFAVTKGTGTIAGLPTATVDSDSDGKAAIVFTLGLEAGLNNNVVTATFEGNAGSPAVFTATADVPGSAANTRVSGVVLDNANQPIPNAQARIAGTSLEAFSDVQGQFSMSGVPVGTVLLEVDGSTSTRPETFPMLAFHVTTVAGQDNTVGMPIFLPPLDTASSRMVGGDETVAVEMSGVPGVVFTVFPRSATFRDGSRIGRVTLTQVHADKVPMPPPFGTAPRIMWTLQPPGTKFDPPIRVQLPNVDNLAPGQIIELIQFDHDIEQFVSVGAARVTADGAFVVSDPGFGVTKAGWGGGPPPPPPNTCVASCDDGDRCTADSCTNGSCAHLPIGNCEPLCPTGNEGVACNDENVCTINDSCRASSCKGDTRPDDGDILPPAFSIAYSLSDIAIVKVVTDLLAKLRYVKNVDASVSVRGVSKARCCPPTMGMGVEKTTSVVIEVNLELREWGIPGLVVPLPPPLHNAIGVFLKGSIAGSSQGDLIKNPCNNEWEGGGGGGVGFALDLIARAKSPEIGRITTKELVVGVTSGGSATCTITGGVQPKQQCDLYFDGISTKVEVEFFNSRISLVPIVIVPPSRGFFETFFPME